MTATTTPRAWRDQAACIGTPSDVHHPATTLDDHGNTPAYAEARTICRACPVILTCLDDALTYEAANGWARTSRHGMYGGLSPGERYKLAQAEHEGVPGARLGAIQNALRIRSRTRQTAGTP